MPFSFGGSQLCQRLGVLLALYITLDLNFSDVAVDLIEALMPAR